jgi:uncharacterized protein (TIGR03437 family)
MRKLLVAALIALPVEGALTQITCDAVADPNQIRYEGLSERLGAIFLTCTGAPGGTVSGGIGLGVSAPITNKLTGERVDATLTAETDTGLRVLSASALLLTRNNLFFDSFTFNVPASGVTNFRIENIRVAADGAPDRGITVFMTTSGMSGIGIRNNPVTAGIARRALYVNYSSNKIVCTGSPIPEALSFGLLFGAGTKFASVRVTEGFPTAFEYRQTGATNGMRMIVRYSGFPETARLYTPDVIAGSSADEQTSTGEFGVTLISGGKYTLGPNGSLLLARVRNADPSGAGDNPVFVPGPAVPGTVGFQEVTEVLLRGGSGYAVYEVVDSSPLAQESAMITTFVAMPRNTPGEGAVATIQVLLGPTSTVRDATSNAPVTRYVETVPLTDCPILRDCNASYFPKLFVDAPQLAFRAPEKTPGFYQAYIRVLNDGGGNLFWTTNIAYRSGAGWLKAFPEAGVNNASINLRALPDNLPAGVYEATFTVDGGPVAGSKSYNVIFTVTPAEGPPPVEPPPVNPNAPRFWTVGNAANLAIANLVPGSLASIQGVKLSGQSVAVTFDGTRAQIINQSDGLLTVVVPAELGFRTSARLAVAVDGASSEEKAVPLAPSAPVIFANSIFNQDGTRNSESNPEGVNRILQIFATGLPTSALGAITARIHGRDILLPYYAGPAPGTPGTQQVNIRIPGDLPAMNSEVEVCGVPVNAPTEPVCSAGAAITIRQ